jgi:uncharacterized protein YkwD
VIAGAAVFLQNLVTGNQPRFEGESRTVSPSIQVPALLPGLPPLTLHRASPYAANDQWREYLADEQTCPGGERTDVPLQQQAMTMVCLVNFARVRRGLQPLATVALLNTSSLAKAARIVRCRDFAHAACGETPESDARAAGYTGSFGENIYLADGPLRAPRVALDGWLNSPGHRENLFNPEWRTEGIAVQNVGDFGRFHDGELWVNEFGTS